MERREFILASAGVLGTTSIGAIAFTNASVERDVTINIAADNNGIIGLSPGTTSGASLVNDTLAIDLSTSNADGLNPSGDFTYGDAAAPTTTYLFALSNNDGSARDFTVDLTGFSLGGSASLDMEFFDSAGASLGTVSNGGSVTFNLAATDVAYAVLSINTDGLTSADDMNGTLAVSAE